MKTKIIKFYHSCDCKKLWLGIKRKGKEKEFKIFGRDGWDLADKVNRVMKCFI